jgi:hypothetical protein
MIFTVQVNGKNKVEINGNPNTENGTIIEKRAHLAAAGWIKGEIKRTIYAGRLINIVCGPKAEE